jgi:limonene 1,2-monooxygenase
MTLAGKHEAGVLSIGSMSKEGIRALPMQWSFAEESAAEHGKTVDRKNWRIVLSWHIAETREEARKQAGAGLVRHNNEYTVGTLAGGEGVMFDNADQAVDAVGFSDVSTAVIGTPDDLVARIREDLVARYVIPEVNGMLDGYRDSNKFVIENRGTWNRASEAIASKIRDNERALEAAELDESEGRPVLRGGRSVSPGVADTRG